MIFTMNRSELQAAVSAPARIAAKSLVTYTSCVLAVAEADQVTFEATDQTESARCAQFALVEQQGSILIPANSLISIIKTLPDEAVTVSSDGDAVRIECGKASFDLPALSPDDFPGFPAVGSSDTVSIPFDIFASMAKAAVPFTAKKDNSREYLKGVFVEYDGSEIKMTATDAYHVVRIVKQCDDLEGNAGFSALIPSAFMLSASSVKYANEAVLSSSDNQVQVTCGSTTLITRAINEQYPAVNRFFDGVEQNARAVFNRDELISATKRAVAVSSTECMTVKIADGRADISLSTQDRGSMHESFEVETEGMCIASFTPVYLLDSLAAMDAENVSVVLENPLKPIIVSAESASCVIMPVRR